MKTQRTYVSADVHTSVTVFEAQTEEGELLSIAKVPTKIPALSAFLLGMPGEVHLVIEEGTQAGWLYERLSPLVYRMVVCDPRKTKSLLCGDKSDKVDAHDLCTFLRNGSLKPVYHGGRGVRDLKQHVFSRDRLVQDATRTKNRLKSIYRGRGLQQPTAGSDYGLAKRDAWLALLDELPGERARAGRLFRQLEAISELLEEAEADMLSVARRHQAWRLIKTVPGIGNVRAAQIVAKVVTPHRFRTKRQFWQYCGFGVVQWRTNEYVEVGGRIERRRGRVGETRGLNKNHSPLLKDAFKGAAQSASGGVFAGFVEERVAQGMRRQMALLTLARKLAAITLAIWKKGERFDIKKALTSR
jgi:transposase